MSKKEGMFMTDKIKNLSQYAVSTVAVIFVLLIKLHYTHYIGAEAPFILFYATLAFTAWYGGLGPSLFSLGLSAILISYYFLAPLYGFGAIETNIRLASYLFEGFIIIVLSVGLKNSRVMLQIREQYFRTLIDNGNDAITILDPEGTISYGSASTKKILNINAKAIVGANIFKMIHPDDVDPLTKAINTIRYDPGASAITELRVSVGSNKWRWIEAVIKNLRDNESINALIANYRDISERKKSEEQLRTSNAHLATVLNGTTEGILVQNSTGTYTYANLVALRILQLERFGDLQQESPAACWEMFRYYTEAGQQINVSELPNFQIAEGKHVEPITVRMVHPMRHIDRWVVIKTIPTVDQSGCMESLLTMIHDVTDSKVREEQLIRSENSYRFLAEIGAILSSSLDYVETLKQMGLFSVPRIADYCSIDIIDLDHNINRLLVTHADPVRAKIAQEINERFPRTGYDEPILESVLKEGKPTYVTGQGLSDLLRQSAQHSEHLELLNQLDLKSLIIVPIMYHDTVLGMFTIGNCSEDYSLENIELAKEIGYRAGMAIENSRLFKAAEQTLQREQEHLALLDTLLGNAPIGFAFFNPQMEVARVNTFLVQMLGLDPTVNYTGIQLADASPILASEVGPLFEQVLSERKPILNIEFNSAKLGLVGPDRFWLKSFYPVFTENNSDVRGVGVLINEITERKLSEQAVSFQAHHDPLTNLPNRKFFQAHLEKILTDQDNLAIKSAILFLDLDSFKNINDSLGHSVGDIVLKMISKRLRECLSSDDFIARWGGDEFIIVLANVSDAKTVMNIAKRVLKVLRESFKIENYTLHISASIGIVVPPFDNTTVEDLIKNADVAMYKAKGSGKNQYQLFNHAMNSKAEERLVLENDLRSAAKNKEIILKYQPIMEASTGKIIAAETLVRWNHPKLGMLSPKEFIEIAEETGTIIPLGKWILSQACKQTQIWQRQMEYSPKVSVNLSGRQFSQLHLVDNIKDIIGDIRLDPTSVELEITETIAMENLERTSSKLQELKAMGVQIVIDDFGTGYSSLAYLKRFPFHKLKIDQSFVRNCIEDEQDAAIIKSIITMAHSLKLSVVAEGVETEEQLKFLVENNCDYIQGYLLSKPLENEDFVAWLHNHYHSETVKYLRVYKDAMAKQRAR